MVTKVSKWEPTGEQWWCPHHIQLISILPWSQLGLFTVFGPHFYRLKSLISPYYMLFGKIQFRNDSLTIFYQIQFKKLFIFQFSTKFNSKIYSYSSFSTKFNSKNYSINSFLMKFNSKNYSFTSFSTKLNSKIY